MSNDLIGVLDAIEIQGADLRRRSYELLVPEPGTVVADVGCGAGRAVAELDEMGVRAEGVDVDAEMVELARRRYPGSRFRVADASALPFADGELAGYRAEKVFHCFEAADTLREARRVLAPGGRIVLLGHDWDAFVVDSDDPARTRQVLRERADQIHAPRSARRYRADLMDAGFTDVRVEARLEVVTGAMGFLLLSSTAKAVPGAGQWLADQERRLAEDRLLVGVPIFVAAATQPPTAKCRR